MSTAAAVFAAGSPKTYWYLTRGSGVVALLLLTASVVLGVLTTMRVESRHWPRFVIERLHRNVSLVVVVFLMLHIATTVLDGYVDVTWIDAVLPFRSPYRTLWLSLGTIAVDLLIAVIVTSLLRTRMSFGTWKAVHWLAYASFPVALVHGWGTGSDSSERWMLALDALCLLAVAVVAIWRILNGPQVVGRSPVVARPPQPRLHASTGPDRDRTRS